MEKFSNVKEGDIVTVIDLGNYNTGVYSELVPFPADVVSLGEATILVRSHWSKNEYEVYANQVAFTEIDDELVDYFDPPIRVMTGTKYVQTLIDALPAEDRAQLSDGFHSFEELYETRDALFVALCGTIYVWQHNGGLKNSTWRSKRHSDGTELDGWFIAGINYQSGQQISFHLPIEMWDDFVFALTLDTAPPFDGHTTKDVIERLKEL